jgi:hypothetical protein
MPATVERLPAPVVRAEQIEVKQTAVLLEMAVPEILVMVPEDRLLLSMQDLAGSVCFGPCRPALLLV